MSIYPDKDDPLIYLDKDDPLSSLGSRRLAVEADGALADAIGALFFQNGVGSSNLLTPRRISAGESNYFD